MMHPTEPGDAQRGEAGDPAHELVAGARRPPALSLLPTHRADSSSVAQRGVFRSGRDTLAGTKCLTVILRMGVCSAGHGSSGLDPLL